MQSLNTLYNVKEKAKKKTAILRPMTPPSEERAISTAGLPIVEKVKKSLFRN